MDSDPKITGVMVNYYFVCHRELWLFAHHIQMEQTSDVVYLGKLIGEESYSRQKKEILIDDLIRIDFIDNVGMIHETKKSNKIEKAHEYQLLYYLYYLKQKGIDNIQGEINYPELRRKTKVELTPEKEAELETIFKGIRLVVESPKPPVPKRVKYCPTCSYFDYCYAE